MKYLPLSGRSLPALVGVVSMVSLSCSDDSEPSSKDGDAASTVASTSGSSPTASNNSQTSASASTSGSGNNNSTNDATSSGGATSESASSNGGSQSSTGGGGTTSASTSSGSGGGLSSAKEIAEHLGRSHFLIGMGNDLDNDHNQDGAYTLGVTLDLHYAYLVGLPGQGGWSDWNEGGTFVNILTDSAEDHGVVPMFTLYAMAAQGEANMYALTDPDYMGPYWEGAKLLFERLGEFGAPAVVHFEPDFWAYTHQHEGDPTEQEVLVGSLLSECEAQPDTMVGMGQCLVSLARQFAPETIVGFHASRWADPEPDEIVRYLSAIGGTMADLVVIETLDRDAGCFEAGDDPNCTRQDGPWYWDETNQTSPNFHEHLAWAKAISDGLGKPLLWWQLPFGVPSDTPGGEPGRYRDNRVKYLFEHVDEFVEAGGVGAVFGVGAGNQTYIDSDGGQFQDAVTKYFADPYEL